jgi:hypothetical protein
MQLAHALTLTQARSSVAALADSAHTLEASSAYERILIALDRIHGDTSPAFDTTGLTSNREVLFAVAASAIGDLEHHGIDALDVELVLAQLDDAHALDGS